ncbi:unnamed protein product [Ascophyllum nodosum]
MLCVPAYTRERKPYSATSPRFLWLARAFSWDGTFWGDRGGGFTRQPVGPLVDTATVTTVMSKNHVDSGSFNSRCCTFRCTHTSANPIRLLFSRLDLPLTLSRPSRFAPSARLMVCVSPRALWLAGAFLCGCTVWDEKGGRLTRQPVGPLVDTVTITTVMSTNHVKSKSFSSRCCTFRGTHTSADPVCLLCIRLALPLTLSWSSRFAPSARLIIYVSTRALWLMGIFNVTVCFRIKGEEDLLGYRCGHRWTQ